MIGKIAKRMGLKRIISVQLRSGRRRVKDSFYLGSRGVQDISYGLNEVGQPVLCVTINKKMFAFAAGEVLETLYEI
jgi:hypothetical protein